MVMKSEYVIPAFDVESIVCRMSEEEWTVEEAQYWADKLTARGFTVVDVYEFHADVKAAFAPYRAGMQKENGGIL